MEQKDSDLKQLNENEKGFWLGAKWETAEKLVNAAGLENHPLVILPVGMVMGLSVAMLGSYRVMAEKVKVCADLELKTSKADEVEDKGENKFTINIWKG